MTNLPTTMVKVGEPFPMFQRSNTLNMEGAILEQMDEGGVLFTIYMADMTKEEEIALRKADVTTKAIEGDDGFLLTMVKFGGTNLVFEMRHDPTLYRDERMRQYENCNMITMIGIDSRTNIVRCIRYASLPTMLYRKWIYHWHRAFGVPSFSSLYRDWVNKMDSRYDIYTLWDRAIYTGKLGERNEKLDHLL